MSDALNYLGIMQHGHFYYKSVQYIQFLYAFFIIK